MSLVAFVWSIEQRVVVDPTARHVLLCLANRAREGGKAAFPSVETLQRDTCLSERTIRYKLDHLESVGAIKKGDRSIAAKFVGRADRTPTCYDICIPKSWLVAWNEHRGAATAPRSSTGCNGEQDQVQIKTLPGAPIAPKPSSERIEDPPLSAHENSGEKEFGPDDSGSELDLSLLPVTLRGDIHRLVSTTDEPQTYVDLLVARMRRDKALPPENHLQHPVRWLKKVISQGNPDFSSVVSINQERETRARQEREAQENFIQLKESENKKVLEIAEAQTFLSSCAEEELLQIANDAIDALPGMKIKFQQEVRSAVFSRSIGKAMTRVAILNVLLCRLANSRQ